MYVYNYVQSQEIINSFSTLYCCHLWLTGGYGDNGSEGVEPCLLVEVGVRLECVGVAGDLGIRTRHSEHVLEACRHACACEKNNNISQSAHMQK